MDGIQLKFLKKVIKPFYNSLLKPFFKDIIKKKESIELNENEEEVVIILFERNGEIMVCAPVLDQDAKVSRYLAINEKEDEAMNLSELLENQLK